MNKNNDASLNLTQDSSLQDQGLLNSDIQAQQPQGLANMVNPWQLAMSANPQFPGLNNVSQQPQIGQLPWPQMSNPQQLQTAMLQMAPFNVPLQIIQEAFSMSQPVDAADEPILLTELLKAKKSEHNFKEALNGLHGTNGHSASLWKDYYLEHKDRLDDWIEKCMEKEKVQAEAYLVTVKKPSPASFKALPKKLSCSVSASSSRHPPANPQRQNPPLPSREHLTPEGRGRRTMNSLSVPAPVFDSRLPAPNASLKVPVPPSRSPTPPTIVIPQHRGNKFTMEDHEFFIKLIGWRLRQNPEHSRQELCEILAEKAPHHSVASWGAYWSNHHDLPDKILAAAKGELDKSDEEKRKIIVKARPNYKDMSTSEDEELENDISSNESDSSTEPVRRYSVSDMGPRNSPFNEADMYFTAKYIASMPDWDSRLHKDRWDAFHAKYPQRTAKSWAEHYRRKEKSLTKLVKKIRRENDSSIMSPFGLPSKGPQKRARLSDDEHDEHSNSRATAKRLKIEDSEEE